MARKKAPPEAETIKMRIAMETGDGAAVFYVNYAEISQTKNDFCLTGGRVPARFGPSKVAEMKETGLLVVEGEVQLILPPTIIPGLIRALSSQKEKYEKTMGIEIKDTGLE